MRLFEHFTARGARACAISLPPDFAPQPVEAVSAATAIDEVLRLGPDASTERLRQSGQFVFWTLAECCADFKLPFDLMIGVNRGVYCRRSISRTRPVR